MTAPLEFAPESLIQHRFLGGSLQILQPKQGYRSGVDAVYLAAAAPAQERERVLDLGAGAGVAAFCLGHRVRDLDLHALEIQPAFAALAQANAAALDIPLTVHAGDVAAEPAALRALSFDGVIANPPYYRAGASLANDAADKDMAQRENVPLTIWIDCALRRLTPGGWIVMIQRAERLAEILIALAGRAGDIRVLPIAGRAGRPASRVLIKARKGARGPLTLCAPFIEHAGPEHLHDGDDFSAEAQAVLRHGRLLNF